MRMPLYFHPRKHLGHRDWLRCGRRTYMCHIRNLGCHLRCNIVKCWICQTCAATSFVIFARMAFAASFHRDWRYLTRCYHSLRVLRQIVVIIHFMQIAPALFSLAFPLFFCRASALCVFLWHYILFRQKKQSYRVVRILFNIYMGQEMAAATWVH